MRDAIQGLGWFARRSPEPHAAIAFYRDVLGLPVLRIREDAPTPHEQEASVMLWAGETAVLWITPGGSRPPVYTNRNQAPMVPLWRVHGFDATLERLTKAGATLIGHLNNEERQIGYFLDPTGNVVGIQERVRTSDRQEDRDAWARWDAGDTRVEGIAPLAPDVQHLGWVVLFTHDVDAEIGFWHGLLGYPLGGRNQRMIPIGEGVLFEIMERDPAFREPAPDDRRTVNDVPILRVRDLDTVVAGLKDAGIHFLNDSFRAKSGSLAYFETPGGTIVGLQERWEGSVRPEDHEADRRWAAR